MARYTNNSQASHETTREDRIEYANKWVDHYSKVKAAMADQKLKTRGEVVEFLVNDWESKAVAKDDEKL